MVRPPCVITTSIRVWLKCPCKIRHSEGSNLSVHTKLLCSLIKGCECSTELPQQQTLGRQLIRVRIEPSKTRKENLPCSAEGCANLNELRDLLQLSGKRVIRWELSLQWLYTANGSL